MSEYGMQSKNIYTMGAVLAEARAVPFLYENP